MQSHICELAFLLTGLAFNCSFSFGISICNIFRNYVALEIPGLNIGLQITPGSRTQS